MTPTALPKRFVSIGEAMLELAPTGAENQFSTGFAGDTLNTAWYLRRKIAADWNVDYVTALGQDSVSDRMIDFLKGAGIGTERIARIEGRTIGLYMIELRNGERSFSYWRGQSAARLLAADASRLAQAIEGAGVIYFSGITLAILEEGGRETLLATLKKARENGAIVAFDPNLRPRLWASTETMCAAIMQAAAHADIVLPSHDDEATWFGDTDLEATATRYQNAGAKLVIVKNGGGEMISTQNGQTSRHSCERITDVVDSTAAGDSFNAGFFAAWLAGEDIETAIAAGGGLASKVIGQRGALCEI